MPDVQRISMFQFAITFAAIMMMSSIAAQDGAMTLLTTKFPVPRYNTVAMYDGEDSVYILGGDTLSFFEIPTEVFKFTLSTEKLEVVANFPKKHYGGNAHWDAEGNIWYFEGKGQGPWKFTPGVGQTPATLINMNATHRDELANSPPGYWNKAENAAYFFGGMGRGTHSQKMSKYLESNNTVVLIPVNGTEYLFQAVQSSVWDEERNTAYLMSINFAGPYISSFVTSFDPNTFQFNDMDLRLPFWVQSSTPVWDGTSIYMVGGFNSSHELIKFNPMTKEVRVLNIPNFPKKLFSASAVYVEKLKRIYVFGGEQLVGRSAQSLDTIFYVTLGRNVGAEVKLEPKVELVGNGEEANMATAKPTTLNPTKDEKNGFAANSADFSRVGSISTLIAAICAMIL